MSQRGHAWDPAQDRERIVADFERLFELLDARGTRLFLVNLPALSWDLDAYPPGRFSTCLELLGEASRGAPLLDLRDLVPDAKFYDYQHVNLVGAARASERTAAFLKEHLRQ